MSFFLILIHFLKLLFCNIDMRLGNDDIISELKLRLEKEKSLSKKVQIKQVIELVKKL